MKVIKSVVVDSAVVVGTREGLPNSASEGPMISMTESRITTILLTKSVRLTTSRTIN